jgi:hypothetical protein
LVKWVGVFLIFRRVGFEIWQCEEEWCFVFYINLICFKSSLFGLEKLYIVWLVQAARVFSFFQLADIQFLWCFDVQELQSLGPTTLFRLYWRLGFSGKECFFFGSFFWGWWITS